MGASCPRHISSDAMNNDDFEKRLQRQPIREIPTEWRVEILSEAKAAAHAVEREVVPQRQRDSSDSRAALPAANWVEWLWPCPQAWAALAAAWLVIIALQLQTPERPKLEASAGAITRIHKTVAFASLRREAVELLDLFASEPPVSRPTKPRPRTEGRPRTAVG